MSSRNNNDNQSSANKTNKNDSKADTNVSRHKSISTLDVLVDRLTRRLVRRYHLDEKPLLENHARESNAMFKNVENQNDESLNTGIILEDGVSLDVSVSEGSPSVGDEMIEYRKYGLEVANQIRDIIHGNASKELAVAKLLNYVESNEDEILFKTKTLALRYIREGQVENPSGGNNDLLSLLQKQRSSWLALPPAISYAPWGVGQYIDIGNNKFQNRSITEQPIRGIWARDKLTIISKNWLDSKTSKDILRPFVLNTINRNDAKSIHNLLRERLCNTTLPYSKEIVNDSMRNGILIFLGDKDYRIWTKQYMTQYIQSNFGGK